MNRFDALAAAIRQRVERARSHSGASEAAIHFHQGDDELAVVYEALNIASEHESGRCRIAEEQDQNRIWEDSLGSSSEP